jgi:hypothetical protein
MHACRLNFDIPPRRVNEFIVEMSVLCREREQEIINSINRGSLVASRAAGGIVEEKSGPGYAVSPSKSYIS